VEEKRKESDLLMYDTKFFPDDVSVAELTKEQYARAIETCSTNVLNVGAFDIDNLIEFVGVVMSVERPNSEDINIIATRNENVKSGTLIAEVCTEERKYFCIAGMKDRE
jgi:hypothetical protein